jgi:hypothetical protein
MVHALPMEKFVGHCCQLFFHPRTFPESAVTQTIFLRLHDQLDKSSGAVQKLFTVVINTGLK